MTDQFDARLDDFIRDLNGEDDLGVVVRGHLWVERELIGYIDAQLVDPTALRPDLDYADRVRLAIALGLDTSLKAPLNALGKVRNRFAHQLGSHLDKSDADNLHKVLPKVAKDTIHSSRVAAHDELGSRGPSRASTQEPRTRYILYITTLWLALVSVNR
jgi:hypothetical protein